jgi:acyl-coenzyme A thioesterase PaaI-like protein
MSVLKMYKKAQKIPFGVWFLSRYVCYKAPYFGSVKPIVSKMESGAVEVTFKKTRAVQNHIGTVHVIAICNAMELAMGMVAEATIPQDLRWLPKSMNVEYPQKSETEYIRVNAVVDKSDFVANSDVKIHVSAIRDDGEVVVEGDIVVWVTEKPKK